MKGKDDVLIIGDRDLSVEDVLYVARYGKKVTLATEAVDRMRKSWAWLQQHPKTLIYGFNTNVGVHFFERTENLKPTQILQWDIVRNHALGLGPPFEKEIVRGTMLLMSHSLSKGLLGVRPLIVETLIRMLNEDVIPFVPSKGSLGSSGDLVPLSHIALVISENPISHTSKSNAMAFYQGTLIDAQEAMLKAGIPRVTLEGIEGLALINGTWLSTAIGALLIADAIRLLKWADVIGAVTMEALRGFQSPFYVPINEKGHPGQLATVKNFTNLLAGSQLSHSVSEVQSLSDTISKYGRIHDPYSIRCIPQVHGSAKEAISFARELIQGEMNAVSGNPLILPDLPYLNKAISGGNFHGQYVSMAMDIASIAVTYLASLSERRIYHLVYGGITGDLPKGLVINTKKDFSTLEIAHYVATSLVCANKLLCHASSVDSLPVASGIEDYVSLATICASKAREALQNAYLVLSIELFLSYKALKLRLAANPKTRLGKGTKACYELISQIDGIDILPVNIAIEQKINRILLDDASITRIEDAIGSRLLILPESTSFE